MPFRFAVFVLLSIFLAAPVLSPQAVSITPLAGDPQVTVIFLRIHARLVDDLSADHIQGSEALDSAHAEVARRIGISSRSLLKLVAAYRKIEVQLDGLDQEALAYVTSKTANKIPVDIQALNQFENRRHAIIQTTINGLRNDPAAEWTAVQSYIDTTFRHYIKRSPLQ